MSSLFTKIKSNRGNDQILFEGYKYHKFRPQKSSITWRCSEKTCTATIKTDLLISNLIETKNKEHKPAHDPPTEKQIDLQQLRTTIKRGAEANLLEPPLKIIRRELQPENKVTTSDIPSLLQASWRVRKKFNLPVPKNIDDAIKKIAKEVTSSGNIIQEHRTKHPPDPTVLSRMRLIDDADDMSSELRLITEIEKYPCLYNFWLPEYSRKDVIKKAWVEIAAKTETPVHDCKEKWRNIRSSFLRSLKAAPTGSKPKKPYYLKKHLHFVIPFIKPMSNTPAGGTSAKRCERVLEIDPDTNSTFPLESESMSNDYRDVVIKVEESEPESEFKLSSELILPDDGGESSTPASLYAATELGDEELSLGSQSQGAQVSQTPQTSKTSSVVRRRKRRTNVALERKINDLKSKIKKLEAGASVARPEPPGPSLGENNGMRYFLVSLLPEFETMTQEQIRAFKIKVMMLIDEMKSK